MTIYDLLYVMDNMNFDIIVQNDALIDEEDGGVDFEGEISIFKDDALYDELQDEEVTDLYTLSDGRMVICYYDEERD